MRPDALQHLRVVVDGQTGKEDQVALWDALGRVGGDDIDRRAQLRLTFHVALVLVDEAHVGLVPVLWPAREDGDLVAGLLGERRKDGSRVATTNDRDVHFTEKLRGWQADDREQRAG